MISAKEARQKTREINKLSVQSFINSLVLELEKEIGRAIGNGKYQVVIEKEECRYPGSFIESLLREKLPEDYYISVTTYYKPSNKQKLWTDLPGMYVIPMHAKYIQIHITRIEVSWS